MESLPENKRKWKQKVLAKRQAIKEKLAMAEIDDLDVKVEFIQTLIPLGLEAVGGMLQKEVRELAGLKHKHGKKNTRWGKQNGSVYLYDQKVPIEVPRVRSKLIDREVKLQSYQKFQHPHAEDKQVLKKLLNGLSMNKYQESAELVPEVFGISASNVSRRFKKATAAKLKYLQRRGLDKYDFVAVFIDGKRFAQEGILIAIGITMEGKKVILGIEQMNSENHRAVGQFFDKLIERGFKFEEGLLFIVDGSKGIIKAIKQRFNSHSLIQRCQWHKRENVVSYLNQAQATLWRRKLKTAYSKTTYTETKDTLIKLGNELEQINSSAAASLREGLEETLTIYKLKLSTELRKSFTSTNCIESVLSQVQQYTQRVDRWRNGAHIKRWVAASLLEVEPALKKVNGYRYLKLLRNRIKEALGQENQEKESVSNEQKSAEVEV